MNIRVSPLYGFMLGFNYLDWGDDSFTNLGYQYEFQIGVGFFIIQLVW